MFINNLCNELEKAKIPYAIVGGYAVALHGAVRGTVDVDLIINWSKENLRSLEKVLNDLGLKSNIPVTSKEIFDNKEEYVKNKNLIAWNFTNQKNPVEQVDIIIIYNLSDYKTHNIETVNGDIKIIDIRDLIKLKKLSNRIQDLEDIKALEKLL